MKIAVYGAAGHTARFIVAELLRRGHTPIAIGRDESRLAAAVALHGGDVGMRIATLDSPALLERALSGAEAVVNCAGPFLDTAQPLIEAALRTRVHYFDLTAEQGSALSTFASFDASARERGIAVLPAAGFYGGLGDLLATDAMRGWARADWIDVAIALERWWPTRGTRLTGERNTAPRLALRDGRLEEIGASAAAPWSFPEPFGTQDVIELPFTETILMARHLRVRDIRNYVNVAPLRDLRDPATPGPVAVDDRGRSNQRFLIDVVVRNGDEERRVTVRGQDIYAVTAPIVVEAVERLCGGPRNEAGAFALGERIDAAAFFQSLIDRGEISVRRASGRIGDGRGRPVLARASECGRQMGPDVAS
jgi:hypothetical protein